MPDQTYRKKLIEVDLPLDAINKEASREKSIRHGHPSTLHQWWAHRPLAACRAIIFASMVDDPSSWPGEFPTEESQRQERHRLHELIRQLVEWKNSNDENLLAQARTEIACSIARHPDKPPFSRNPASSSSDGRGRLNETPRGEGDPALQYLKENSPTLYDPFCGRGSIPLEAQRLGMKAVGSDLNPIAVLITKALTEIPPRFANRPPINPDADPLGITKGRGKNKQHVPWRGAAGLANDIRYYGKWMREEAFKRIGHFYPQATSPDGSKATVIAWLWARTIPCPNPACGIKMPLIKTFQLSKKRNNQHWIRPIIDSDAKSTSFQVQNNDFGVPEEPTVNRNGATCAGCGNTVRLGYVREQARAGNMGEQMTAVVVKGDRKRLFMSPDEEHIQSAINAEPAWRPDQAITPNPKVSALAYGTTHWHQLFTERQLLALTTFSDLIPEVQTLIIKNGADEEYANAICTYLSLSVSKNADYGSSFASWHNSREIIRNIFARQAIAMIWDFAEVNYFSESTGNWMAQISWIAKAVEHVPAIPNMGEAHQADASTTIHAEDGPVIVTDPPYYNNINYADLSDFFYVWLRPLLRDTYPDLFAGILTPKTDEMIAAPRFDNPRQRFERSLRKTFELIRNRCTDDYPSSIFYAYKQQEEQRGGQTSTGWETILNALIMTGFQIVGTWPMRTELSNRPNSLDANSLASSVILVCRPRPADAPICTRRQFFGELRSELPKALRQLTHQGHIAPTDLAQAAIGPGMEIYSKYSSVQTVSGQPVTVREALQAINRVIDEFDEEESGAADAESQFCVAWMKECQFMPGEFGVAEVLSQAKNIDITNLADTHQLLTSRDGKVQLSSIDEFHPERPYPITPMTAWEACMRIAYNMDGRREDAAATQGSAEVVHHMGSDAESVERLARVLYNYFDGRGEARNALLFNELVTSWQDIRAKANEIVTARQTSF